MQVDFRTLQAGDPNSTSSEGVFLDDGAHKLSDPTILSARFRSACVFSGTPARQTFVHLIAVLITNHSKLSTTS